MACSGALHEELETLFPDIMAEYRSYDPDYVVPGGESARDIYRRVVDLCRKSPNAIREKLSSSPPTVEQWASSFAMSSASPWTSLGASGQKTHR